MASPVLSSAGTGGDLLSNGSGAPFSLGASKITGFFLDVATSFDGQFDIFMKTGSAVASTYGMSIQIFRVVAQTTLTQAQNSGDSSFIPSAAGFLIANGHAVIGNNVSAVAGGFDYFKLGANTAGTIALNGSTLLYNHSVGDRVYLIPETVWVGAPTIGTNANNTVSTFSGALPPGQYVVILTNLDATNAITAWAQSRYVTAIS